VPTLTVFAGPNGSGKSSVLARADFEGRENLLDADAIAMRINSKNPHQAAIAAGREMLRRTVEYIRRSESFAIETTLAGGWTTAAIQAAVDQGFLVRLLYICVSNPEWSIQRVRERVARGGHDIPDEDIRRRYDRSLANAQQLVKIVDEVLAYDNTSGEPKLVFEMQAGTVVRAAADLPRWAAGLLQVTM
jgi:predicted ABC-type ATPase